MSKEYIERGALIDKISKLKTGGIFTEAFKKVVLEIISNQPTDDVQEVRRGKNVTTMNPVDEFECSECGFVCEIQESIYDDEHTLDCQREYNPKFCPNCGAKMDKE